MNDPFWTVQSSSPAGPGRRPGGTASPSRVSAFRARRPRVPDTLETTLERLDAAGEAVDPSAAALTRPAPRASTRRMKIGEARRRVPAAPVRLGVDRGAGDRRLRE